MSHFKRFSLLFLTIIYGQDCLAQNDSLLQQLTTQTGAAYILTAIEFGGKNYYKDPVNTISVCTKALTKAESLHNHTLQGKCCNIIGLSHWMTGNLDSAEWMFQTAVKKSMNSQDTTFRSKAVSNLARLYAAKTMYDSALKYSISALKIQETLQDSVAISTTLASIGKIYIYLDDMTTALDYQQQAKAFLRSDLHVAQLGKIDNTIGYIYDELGKYDSAVIYYNTSLLNKGKAGDYIGELYTTTNMCVALRNLGKDAEALSCNKKALGLSRELNAPEIEAINLLNIGVNLSDLSQYRSSIKYLDSATVLLENQQDVRNLRETEGMYWFNYEKLGDYKNAFEHHKKYKAYADSILNIDKVAAVEDLRTQYESDKKEAENVLLQAQSDADALKISKKNNTIVGIVVGSSLIIGIILLLFNRNRLKQKAIQAQKDADNQTAITIAEINSRESERKRISRELHDGIGQQLTAINFAWESVNNSQNSENNISKLIQQAAKDVRSISHQMMPKSLMTLGLDKALKEMVDQIPHNDSLAISYQSFGKLKSLTEQTAVNIYRIVQECLNNAIKHAGANSISITLANVANTLSVTVEDDGIGFDTASTSGHGLPNLHYRAKMIEANFSIESSSNGTTCVLHKTI